jgi:hypothetical protein
MGTPAAIRRRVAFLDLVRKIDDHLRPPDPRILVNYTK